MLKDDENREQKVEMDVSHEPLRCLCGSFDDSTHEFFPFVEEWEAEMIQGPPEELIKPIDNKTNRNGWKKNWSKTCYLP